MNISVFGLGYVGCVSVGCLSKNGHNLIGVDVNPLKVNQINKGIPTIIEKDIDKIIEEGFRKNRIKATLDFSEAISCTDATIICVGTPSTDKGDLDLSYIYNTAKQIGESIRGKNTFHTILIRSTVQPGTNKEVCKIIEEVSGKKSKKDFSVVSNPEFLREGSAVKDYFNPPFTLIGTDNPESINIAKEIYSEVNAPLEVVDIKIAEMIKYINNSFHALKIAFANEIGNISNKININSQELMRIFCLDNQLNISARYLRPGFAYGGSCLPKDLRALKTLAGDHSVLTPVIDSIHTSNEYHKKVVLDLILSIKKNKIGFYGISFKAGTDDLRYSPAIDIIEKLIQNDNDIIIYDKFVSLSKIIGNNKSYIEQKLPHISSLMTNNTDEFLSNSDVIVIPNDDKELINVRIPDSTIIIDLVGVDSLKKHKNYIGLNW